jgi:hypothetical protein
MPMNPFLLPLVASITLPLPLPFSLVLVEDGPPSFCSREVSQAVLQGVESDHDIPL